MRLKREIIAIILVICMLFTITAISAADSSADAVSATNSSEETVNVANDNSLGMENDGEILGEGVVGTFTNLKNNITNAASGSTLELNTDFELSTTTDSAIVSNIGIDIEKTLTIDGKGHYIDAKEKTNVFNLYNKVTLKNIIFKNGKSGYGGFIYYYTSQRCEINNCTFINGYSTSAGGAVYSYGTSVDVSNSTFINNYANGNGGALYINAYNFGNIENCTFINNSATGEGSAIHGYSDGTISNSIFINNNGNTIINSNSGTTATYNWFGNTIKDYETNVPAVGSGVTVNNYYVLDMSLDNDNGEATVSLNNLCENGVLVPNDQNYVLSSIKFDVKASGTTTDVNSIIIGSSGVETFTYVPADAYLITISNSTVELTKEVTPTFILLNNQINENGVSEITLNQDYEWDSSKDLGLTNGIEFAKDMTLDGQAHIIDAKGSKNIFYFDDSSESYSLTLKNIIFKNAVTTANGAAVYFNGKKIEIINCTFINNNADGEGDAVYIANAKSSENKITESRFENNLGGNSVVYINLESNDALNLSNSIFINNAANYNVKGTSNAVVDYNWWGNTEENYNTNIAKVDGVTLSKWLFLKIDSEADISGVATVSLNNLYGGSNVGTFSEYAVPSFSLDISKINAQTDADTVTLDDDGEATFSFTMIKTSVSLTVTYEDYISTTKELTYTIVDDGSFNALSDLIWFNENGVLDLTQDYAFVDGVDTITGGIWINKQLTINGNGKTIDANGKAAIFLLAHIIELNYITFANAISDYGGAIYNSGGRCTVNFCTFENNSVTDNGGAVYTYQGSIKFVNCTFGNNSATRGGAFYNYQGTSNFINCTFGNNSASTAGVIYSNNGNSNSFTNCTFENNSATNAGVSYNYYSHNTYDNCSFKNNTANQGAVSYAQGYTDTFKDSELIGNNANSGSILYVYANTASADNCVIINNTATSSVIYSRNAYTLKNSILLNNSGSYIIDADYLSTLTLDYNWFGNNLTNYNEKPNFRSVSGDNVNLNNWYYLDIDTVKNLATISLKLTDGTQDIENTPSLPNINLTIENENLTIAKEITLKSGKANVPYEFIGDNESGLLTVKQTTTKMTKEIKVGDFDILQKLINENDDVIELTRNYTYGINDDITDGIIINKKITINGNGHTIDARGKSRIFNITGSEVVINNVTLINGKADDGAAIYWNGEDGTLKSSVIVNNTGNSAIYWAATGGDINNCVILNNSAKNIISTQSDLKADNNWFGNNASNKNTNMANVEGVTINNWYFLDIELTSSNAKITLNNLYKVSDDEVETNVVNELPDVDFTLTGENITAQDNAIIKKGSSNIQITPEYKDLYLIASYMGASYNKTMSFTEGDFAILQNLITEVSNNGGGIVELDRNYNYIIGVDTITTGISINHANIVIKGNGHTINAKGKSRIFNVGSSATNLTINNVTFINGKVLGEGGAIQWNGADYGVIGNSSFKNNSASDNGGAITWIKGKNLNISYSYFIQNSAVSAGAIYLNNGYSDTMTIFNSTFTNNSVTSQGGVIKGYSTSNLVIDKSQFFNNSAYDGSESLGGAIYWMASNLLINNSCLSNNFVNAKSKDGRGGVIYLYSGTLTINNSTFTNNSAYTRSTSSSYSARGGVIFKYGGTLNVDNSIFSSNSISAYSSRNAQGAVIYWGDGEGTIDNSTFINNHAKTSGGVIFGTKSTSNAKILNSIFLNNTIGSDNTLEVIRRYSSGTFTFENNWFGNYLGDTSPAIGISSGTGVILTNWLYMDATHDDYMLVGKDSNVQFVFKQNTNNEVYDSSKLPKLNLTLSSINGELNKNHAALDENILFNANQVGSASITGETLGKSVTIPLEARYLSKIITEESIEIPVGKSILITASLADEQSNPITGELRLVGDNNDEIIETMYNAILGIKDGTSSFNITFAGDETYAPAKVTVSVTVKYLTDTSLSVDNATPKYWDEIIVTPEIKYGTLDTSLGTITYDQDIDEGTVIYYIGDEAISEELAYNAPFTWTVDRTGEYNITAKYSGSYKYFSSEKNITITASKADTTASVEVSSDTYGAESTITVTSIVPGEYTIDINGTEVKVTIPEGQTSVQTTHKFGANTYYANISGTPESNNYNIKTQNGTFTVTPAANSATIAIAETTYLPGSVTVQVTGGVKGKYLVTISNGQTVEVEVAEDNGVESNTLNIAAGTDYTATLSLDNSNYTTTGNEVTFNVVKSPNVVTVSVNENNYLPGAVTVNVEANVAGDYTVTVGEGKSIVVKVDETTYRGSNTVNLPAGTGYVATTTFDDTDNYDVTIHTATFNVIKSTNAVTITSEGAEYPEKVTITVTAQIAGTYNVKINDTVSHSFVIAADGGSDEYRVLLDVNSYAPQLDGYEHDNYTASVTSPGFSVSKGTNTITISSDGATYPDVVTIKVEANVTGTYTVSISNGTATYTVPVTVDSTGSGNNTIKINAGENYQATTDWSSSNYDVVLTPATFTVEKGDINVKLIIPTPVGYGNETTGTVEADVPGTYYVSVPGKDPVEVVITGTQNTFSLGILDVSPYTATVSIPESANYNAQQNHTNFEVKAGLTPFEAKSDKTEYVYGETVTLSYYDLPDEATGTVQFKYSNETVIATLTVGESSEYVIPKTLDVKQYTIIANYVSDNPNYDSRERTINFEVVKAENKISVEVIADTYPSDVTVMVNATVEGTYKIDINGTEVEVIANSTEGTPVHLAAGNYYANITYSHNNYYGTTTNTTFTLNKADLTAKVIVDTVVLPGDTTVKIIDAVKGVYHVVINDTYSLDITVGDSQTGQGTINLPAGANYWANATFADAQNYTNKIENATFDVNKADNNIRVFVESVDYPIDVIVKLEADIDGTYKVKIGEEIYDVVANDPRGISLKLAAGDYQANVIEYTSPYYNGVITNASFTVRKAFNVVVITVDDKTLPGDVVVNVTATVAGTYTVEINKTKVNVTVGDERKGSNSTHLPAGVKYTATTTFENENYTAMIVPATFDVNKAENNIKVVVEKTNDLEVNVKVISDQPGTYKVDINNTIKEIEANGVGLTLKLPAGDYYANITGYVDDDYEGITSNATFTVDKLEAGLAADGFYVNVNEDNTITVLNKQDDMELTFTSSDETVATVDGEGKVTGIKAGSVNITITSSGSQNYSDETIVVSVTVKKISAGIKVDKPTITVNVKGSEKINVTSLYDDYDGVFTYVSENETAATVDSEGNVVGIQYGRLMIWVSATGSEKYKDEPNIPVFVTVNKIPSGIDVKEDSFTINADENKSVELISIPDDFNGNIVYQSNDTSVAIVNESTGVVTAIKAGTAKITAKITDSKLYADETIDVTVTVNKIDFNLVGEDIVVKINETAVISLNIPSQYSYETITFQSSDDSIAIVNETTGKIKAIRNGTATITITASNSDKYNDNVTVITVSVNKLPVIIEVNQIPELKVDDPEYLSPYIEDLDAEFSYVSSDPSIVSVDDEGNVHALKAGKVNITIIFAGNDDYLANETNVSVTVSKLPSQLSADDLEISAFDSGNIEIYPDEFDGEITYESNDTSIATVDSEGKVTAIKAGTATITITAINSDVYEDDSINITVTVTKISADLKVEESITMNALNSTAISLSTDERFDGEITYESSNSSVVSVDDKGIITAHKAGSATITVTAAGSDKFDDESAKVTVNVNKLASTVTLDVSNITVGENATAFVTFTDKGTLNITITKGSDVIKSENIDVNSYYKYVIPDLNVGTYSITAKFDGNDIYNKSETFMKFTVNPIYKYEFDAKVADAVLGQTTNVTITLPGGATGKIRIGTQEYDIPSAVTLPVQNIAGQNNVTVEYVPDENSPYASSEITAYYNVAKKQSEIKINVSQDLKAGEDAVIVIDAYDGADISVYVDGEKQIVSDNKVTVPATAGTHSVIVNVAESDEYAAFNANTTFKVVKNTPTLTINATNVKVSEKTVIAINITDSATGFVIVNVNGTEYSVDLANAKSVEVALNKAGKYDISAKYLGDDIFDSADSNAVSVEASEKAQSNINVEIPSNIKVGDKVEINITSDNDNITVFINDTLQTVVNGKVEYEVSNAGSLPIVVIAGETKEYASEIYVNTLTAEKREASVEIILPEEIEIGKDIEVTVKSYDAAQIIVTVDGKAQTLVDNKFTVKPAAGVHTIIAGVEETDKFLSASANKTFTVDKLTSEISLTATDTKVGETSTVSVNVTSEATGIVIVTVDGTQYFINLENATSVDVLMNSAGKFNVSAKYLGDDIYNASESAVKTIEVAEKETPVVNVTIPEVKAGDDGNITLNIPDATGLVYVIVDGETKAVALENGSASYPVENMKAGKHTITVIYPGDENNEMAIASQSFTIDKKSSDVNVTLGDDREMEISVPDATGNVTVIIDGVSKTLPLDKYGNANYTIPEMKAGDHSVVVIYEGDDTHSASFTSQRISVKVLATEFTDIVISDDLKIKVVLLDEQGNPVSNASVIYSITGVNKTAVTQADGSFVIAGKNGAEIIMNYAGDGFYLPTNTSIRLANITAPAVVQVESRFDIPNNSITVYGYAIDKKAGEKGMTYATTLLDANGNPIANVPIQFGVNSKIYNRTTYANGSFAPYHLDMVRAGVYTLAFSFAGNENYTSSFAIVALNLAKKPITIKTSSKAFKVSATKKYTITLSTIVGSSADQKAHLRSGLKVTMKIDGKTYTSKTNSKGQVTFNLKINKRGKFAATISTLEDQTYETTTKSVKITIR